MKHLFFAVTALLCCAGCATLENKALALGSGVDAFKLETTGSVSSGTLLPNIIAGGAVNTLATAPASLNVPAALAGLAAVVAFIVLLGLLIHRSGQKVKKEYALGYNVPKNLVTGG